MRQMRLKVLRVFGRDQASRGGGGGGVGRKEGHPKRSLSPIRLDPQTLRPLNPTLTAPRTFKALKGLQPSFKP